VIDWAPRLGSFLQRELGVDGPLHVERILGGQSNPTWFVDAGDRRLVMRMQPHGELLPSAHAVDREFRVMRALEGSSVPVPRVLAFSGDRSIVGTPFYVMERVDGRIFSDSALAGVTPQERRAMYRSAAQTLAALHRVDWNARGLADYGKHSDYFARQLRRWSKQWEGSRLREIPMLERLIAWLPAHIPPENPAAIAHGDYRIGNLIFDPALPKVNAVLDWELSTLGDPLADVGYFCMLYHIGAAEYGGVCDLNLERLGIPSEEELVEEYRRAFGGDVRLEPFHVAFALFRFAVIFVGIEARAQQGNAADQATAQRVAGFADRFAERACELLGV